MKLTNEQKKKLTTRLDNKIIDIVKPSEMSLEEYKIQCNLSGFEASVKDGSFLHWVLVNNRNETMTKLIINALKHEYLLDLDDELQCEYFCDALPELVTSNKYFLIDIIKVIFDKYKDTPMFDVCWSLNHAFGFIDDYYFSKTKRHLNYV